MARGQAKAAAAPRQRINFRELPRRIGYAISHVYGGQSSLFTLIVWVSFILVGFGLLMVLSSSAIDSIRVNNGNATYMFQKQVIFATVGFVLLTAAAVFPLAWYERVAPVVFLAMMGLQLLAVTIGRSVNGNREWLPLPGGFSLQPAEFLKLGMVVMVARFLYQRHEYADHPRYYTWPAFAVPAFVIISVMLGSDLGTSLVIGSVAFGLVWLSGAPGQDLRLPLVIGVIGVIAAVNFTGSRTGRISAWLHTDYSNDTGTYAWQTVHAAWALANANIIGTGLGQSSLKWSWIPEVENDYIFAIIGEELGIIGALGTIAMFLWLCYLIMKVGLRAGSLFGRFICLGIGLWFLLQSMVNISVVLGVLPVLGVPLPLISAGGSSLIAGMAAIGVVLAVERQNHLELDGGSRKPKLVRV